MQYPSLLIKIMCDTVAFHRLRLLTLRFPTMNKHTLAISEQTVKVITGARHSISTFVVFFRTPIIRRDIHFITLTGGWIVENPARLTRFSPINFTQILRWNVKRGLIHPLCISVGQKTNDDVVAPTVVPWITVIIRRRDYLGDEWY
jgi:hypothetical protein